MPARREHAQDSGKRPQPTRITAAGHSTAALPRAKGTASTRVSFSLLHIQTARIFANQVDQLENLADGQAFQRSWPEILAGATGAVLASVASLESYINETFASPERNFPKVPSLVMNELWRAYERRSIIEKYQLALAVWEKGSPFARGSELCEDVAALIKLRNEITHFKPEWDHEEGRHKNLSRTLARRFNRSPFFPSTTPLFPTAWASSSCSSWAVRSVTDFILNFEERSELPRRMADWFNRTTI